MPKIGSGQKTGSGDFVVTGLGFQPKAILIIATDWTSTNMNFSIAVDDGVSGQMIICQAQHTSMDFVEGKCIKIYKDASNSMEGVLTIQSDGFTITFTEIGTSGAKFIWMAFE